MAETFSIAAKNIASIVDGSEIRSVDYAFEILDLSPTPLPAMIPRAGAVKLGIDMAYEKVVMKRLPRTVANAANVVTADTALTLSTSDAARLQVGHLLLIDNEIVRVNAVATSTTVGITKGFSGTTSTTHTTSSTIQVMSPVFADGATFVQSPSHLGEFKSFYPFVIQYEDTEQAVRSATATYLEKGQDPLEFNKAQLRKERIAELERLLIYSRQSIMTDSLAGAPAGIRQLIATNATTVSAALTATNIEDMLDSIYSYDGNINGVMVMGNRTMKRIWNAVWRQYFSKMGEPEPTGKVGVSVDVYVSDLGELRFLTVDAAPSGELLFFRKDSFTLHPLDWAFGSGWMEFERDVKITNAMSKSWGMYSGWVFCVDDERRCGKLTSITTTSTSYPGFV